MRISIIAIAILLSSLHASGCTNATDQTGDATGKQATCTNNDLCNNAVYGKVRKITTISYADAVMNGDKIVKWRTVDSNITTYDEKGFITHMAMFRRGEPGQSKVTYRGLQDGSREIKFYYDSDQPMSTRVELRSGKTIKEEGKDPNGSVVRKTSTLDEHYRLSSTEEKKQGKDGAINRTTVISMKYDENGNKKLMNISVSEPNGQSISADNNFTNFENDKNGNTLRQLSVLKSDMGNMSLYTEYIYDYYQ